MGRCPRPRRLVYSASTHMRARLSRTSLVGAALLVGACGASDVDPAGAVDTTIPGPEPAKSEAPPPAAPADPSPSAPATSPSATPPSEYETEKAWAETHGVVIEAGRTTVVAKRHGSDARSTTYDDELVVLRSDSTIVRFVGTTKPAQLLTPTSTVGIDVNGDGRKDLGIVRPGVYRAHGGVTYGLPGNERAAFKVSTEQDESGLPAWRDTSGDGVFSAAEKADAEARDLRISGVYIHYGFDPAGTTLGGKKYAGPWSVGCQNVKYQELDAFVAAVGGAGAIFRYAIVGD